MAGRGKGPLAGVKVLDLTSVLMGPYATQIFADLGADVIKVEDPRGDTTRHLPPGPQPGRGAMFINLNRGKRSLALDLKQPAARDALLKLAADADVFVHSMRAGAIRRLGLDYSVVRTANPQIIYANLYGFGRAGRYRDYPAYDDIVQAASGLADLQARLNGGEPAYLATVVADKVAGLTAAYAISAALYAREKGNGGQEIEVPMFETLASFAFAEHLCGSLFDPPLGPPEYPRVVSPQRRPYRTKDGFLGVMIYTDQHWRAFFDAVGNPDWSRDEIFATITSRTHNITEVLGRLADLLVTRTNAEWMEVLTKAQVPAMPIKSLGDLLDDPHLADAGFWVERDSPDGKMRFPAIPTDFSKTPGEIGDPAPALGKDGESVLAAAGWGSAEIQALKDSGALLGC
jgi:crotonobetainyl-CoA:carnitine CoA-transferase CaiB-like acyl-CoA transferase